MRIIVKVKPNARQEKVEQAGDLYTVHVKEPARENKANLAVIRVLAEHFGVPRSRIAILRGEKSKQKIVEISS